MKHDSNMITLSSIISWMTIQCPWWFWVHHAVEILWWREEGPVLLCPHGWALPTVHSPSILHIHPMHQTLKNTSKLLPLQNFLITHYLIVTFWKNEDNLKRVAHMLAIITADCSLKILTNMIKVCLLKENNL